MNVWKEELTMRCPMDNGDHDGALLDYCAGRHTPARAAELEIHLAECVSCRDFVQQQRQLNELLASWGPESITPDFDRRLHARIAAEERRGWLGRLLGDRADWRPAVPFAAAAGAAVLAVFLGAPPSRVTPSLDTIQERTRVETLDAEQVERAVEDVEMLRQFSTPASTQPL